MTRITLRSATLADKAMLERWDRAPHVRAAFGEDAAPDWDDDLAGSHAYAERVIAEADGRAIGYMEILNPALEPTRYWGDVNGDIRAVDIWIGDAQDLGLGFGTEMMRLALTRCFGDPAVSAVMIDPLQSNMRAIKFYERLGFVHVGPRVFERATCAVMRLDRATWVEELGKESDSDAAI